VGFARVFLEKQFFIIFSCDRSSELRWPTFSKIFTTTDFCACGKVGAYGRRKIGAGSTIS
jgi:hypothetical protein